MAGRIKLLNSFVIRILCNIRKGKISTFAVLGGEKDLVEIIISSVPHYHCFRELCHLKCGGVSLRGGMAISI